MPCWCSCDYYSSGSCYRYYHCTCFSCSTITNGPGNALPNTLANFRFSNSGATSDSATAGCSSSSVAGDPSTSNGFPFAFCTAGVQCQHGTK